MIFLDSKMFTFFRNRAAKDRLKQDNTNVTFKDRVCANFFAEDQCTGMLVE